MNPNTATIDIVNASDRVFWLSTKAASMRDCMAKFDEIRAENPRETLHLVRSWAPNIGDAFEFEYLKPLGLASVASNSDLPGARLEIWHAKSMRNPPSGENPVNKVEYTLAGRVVVPLEPTDPETLEKGFEFSQNVNNPWNPLKPARSTSVGDVFVLRAPGHPTEGVAYLVRGSSFVKVMFS